MLSNDGRGIRPTKPDTGPLRQDILFWLIVKTEIITPSSPLRQREPLKNNFELTSSHENLATHFCQILLFMAKFYKYEFFIRCKFLKKEGSGGLNIPFVTF